MIKNATKWGRIFYIIKCLKTFEKKEKYEGEHSGLHKIIDLSIDSHYIEKC